MFGIKQIGNDYDCRFYCRINIHSGKETACKKSIIFEFLFVIKICFYHWLRNRFDDTKVGVGTQAGKE